MSDFLKKSFCSFSCFFFLLILVLPFSLLKAQQLEPDPQDERLFEEGLSFYRSFNFAQAESLFALAESVPESILLRGNSLFKLGKYDEARDVLNLARALPMPDMVNEAGYTLSLIHLGLREYAEGLSLLHELRSSENPSLRERSQSLFSDYCMFFTYDQRITLLNAVSEPDLMQEVIRCGLMLHNADEARQLFGYARRQQLDRDAIRELRELHETRQQEMEDTEEEVEADSRLEFTPFAMPDADKPELLEEQAQQSSLSDIFNEKIAAYRVPAGFTYRIGVVLPQDDRDHDGYEVSRAIYYGFLYAVEEYNRNQNDTKIEIVTLGTGMDEEEERLLVDWKYNLYNPYEAPENEAVIQEPYVDEIDEDLQPDFRKRTLQLIEKHQPDILFGPLFSNEALILAALGDSLQIPVLAPLANAEDLTRGNRFVFHANPTFAERGRIMAEIAVNYLGHRKISVLVDRTSLGADDARAFRERALELGAEIPYFFNENLQARRFDISEYADYFAGDISLIDFDDEEDEEKFAEDWVKSDALYMPVAGEGAPAVIDLMMTQLLALRSDVQLIGSEAFGLSDLNRQAARRLRVVYPEVFYHDNSDSGIQDFRDDYRAAFGHNPDMFSYIGYDNARFLSSVIDMAKNPAFMREALLSHEPFDGLAQRFSFQGRQINGALMLFEFVDGRFRLKNLPDEPPYDLLAIRDKQSEAFSLLIYLTDDHDPDNLKETYLIYREGRTEASEDTVEAFKLLDRLELRDVEAVFKKLTEPPENDR